MVMLRGLWRLSHFDVAGFACFTTDARGFWRSFLAALLCLPVWVLAQIEQISHLEDAVRLHFILVQSIAYGVAWLAYPLLALKVSDMFGVWPAYYRYMTAYNWFRTVLQLIWLPLLLLNLLPGRLSPGLLALMWLMLQTVEFCYDWFLARRGLGLAATTATALAMIDFLLGLLIDEIGSMV
jgi:hypothetical protein